MKIIALLPVKNESWAIPSYLSTVSLIADEILALDDSSDDDSALILATAGATVLRYDATQERIVNMSARRQRLLEAGRAAGGTHFIWLDADETFSADFIPNARQIIAELHPGQKLTMRWVHAWKDPVHYMNDRRSPYGCIWKDFIVCDDEESKFTDRFLSEARTPGLHNNPRVLPEQNGVVLHWQFARWDVTQYKQAFYRCTELLEGTRGPWRINHMYSITLDAGELQTERMPEAWTHQVALPRLEETSTNHYRSSLHNLFDQYGIARFEPLEIWHIAELRERFLQELKRGPRPSVAPQWLLKLNELKNKAKNWYHAYFS